MNTKQKLLLILKSQKNNLISGPTLAKELNVTRSYVNKAILELIKEGYEIEKTRSGYIYKSSIRVLNLEKIKEKINYQDLEILLFDEIDSTNDYLKRIQDKKDKITIAIANHQTNGRGRLGRNFVSNYAKGIYMSILFPYAFDVKYIKRITTKAAVVISNVIDSFINTKTQIKWVNDIYLNAKKICGILTTGATNLETGYLDYAILGIGINVYNQEFKEDIKKIASSIEKETNQVIDRNHLIANIINETIKEIKNIENTDYVKNYKEKCFVIGKCVEINTLEAKEIVKVIDLDDDCELIVEKDGKIKKVFSGEISRLVINYE